jgi:hypothetical protein
VQISGRAQVRKEILSYLRQEKQMDKVMIVLSGEEKKLILSSLMSDKVGNWGDGRSEKLSSLINKIKETKQMPEITGFTK